jgi:hypothetical protein
MTPNVRTIVAMSFSWKRRMAAMPAAPACRQDFGVLQSDSSECENRDFGAAGLAESVEAGGSGSGGVFFSKTGAKTARVRAAGCGLDDFFWGVTGDGDQRISW